jgi:hypothetical protein
VWAVQLNREIGYRKIDIRGEGLREVKTWRRKLLALWAVLAACWMSYAFAQPRSYYGSPYFYEGENLLISFALLPPLITLLACLIFAWVWRRHVEVHWLKLPSHLRRGFLRLYLVIAVPWGAWFGFQILINGPRWRYLSHASLSLLLLPIGLPVLFLAIVWVLEGFQKSTSKVEGPPPLPKVTGAPQPQAGQAAPRLPHDYYPLISRAVAQLPIKTHATRQDLYRRAREALHKQLEGQEPSRAAREWRSFEQAISRVEADMASARRRALFTGTVAQRDEHKFEPQSTALLILSIAFASKLWAIDCTCVSLYWVARLPKD